MSNLNNIERLGVPNTGRRAGRSDFSNLPQLREERDRLNREIQDIERSGRTDRDKLSLRQPKADRLEEVERMIQARGGGFGDEPPLSPTNFDDDMDAELEGITSTMDRLDVGRDREDRPDRPIPDSKVADESAGSKEEHKREDAMDGVKAEADAGGKSAGVDDNRKRGRDDDGGAGAKRQKEMGAGFVSIPSRGRTKLSHKIKGGAMDESGVKGGGFNPASLLPLLAFL